MRRLWMAAALLGACCATAETGPPADGETLRYSVNWPSGLPLGEGEFRAAKVATGEDPSAAQWRFSMTLEAGLPGFEISDQYRSLASADLCSLEFEKHVRHGRRKAAERTVFDAARGVATRQTLGGGKSELSIPACARDGLAFLYFLRRELSRGRLPGPQKIFFGAPYEIRLEYGGRHTVRLHEERLPADRLIASVTGKASQVTFELFFSTDGARTLLLARAPFPLGNFTMELLREP